MQEDKVNRVTICLDSPVQKTGEGKIMAEQSEAFAITPIKMSDQCHFLDDMQDDDDEEQQFLNTENDEVTVGAYSYLEAKESRKFQVKGVPLCSMPTLHDLLADQWVQEEDDGYAAVRREEEMNDGSIMNEILIPLSPLQYKEQTRPRFDSDFDQMWSASENGLKAGSEDHQVMNLSQELAMLDFDESFVSQQHVMEQQPQKASGLDLSEPPRKIDVVQPLEEEILLTKTAAEDLQISVEQEPVVQQISLPVNQPIVHSANPKKVDHPTAPAGKPRQKPGKKAMETKKYVQRCLT